MNKKTIGFIGGGRIVRIILGALQRKNQLPDKVIVSDTDETVLKHLKDMFPTIEISLNDNTKPASCKIVFLALHPPIIKEALIKISSLMNKNTKLISLAPKVKIAQLSEMLNGFNNIIRMIPNAPSLINEGYNPVCFSSGINENEKKEISNFLSLFGECPEVKEDLLEGYAIITAMGPTYFWYQFLELKKIALDFGFEDKEAEKAIKAMIYGAVRTMYESGLNSDEIIDLIPAKPMKEIEVSVKEAYNEKLKELFKKLKS